jgi:YD repeat-containing protein
VAAARDPHDTTDSAGAVFGFDANGNKLRACTSTYTYDAADRLTAASLGSTTQT